ncbi:sensor histidine kinase, partial [Actinophytocola sp.]|uniref:sensor histidine kinase n=1 Tax=Actinophytocola sp. TaxID=1872138 RepID=UPI002D80B749
RIARELHDAVTQKLFSLRLTAEAAGALLAGDPVRAGAELATVRRLAAEASDELRAIVVGQRSVDLTGDELDVALRKQVELLDRVHQVRIRFTGTGLPRLAGDVSQAVFRVAQEALHNALRHADATGVQVDLVGRNGVVVLAVTDDGCGFDPEATGRRLGLVSMRERARAVGGRLAVRSAPGAGTTVRLEVPAGG